MKNEKIYFIVGLVSIFLFMLVAGYCWIYILVESDENTKRIERSKLERQRIEKLIADEHLVISEEKPIINYIYQDP